MRFDQWYKAPVRGHVRAFLQVTETPGRPSHAGGRRYDPAMDRVVLSANCPREVENACDATTDIEM